MNANAVASVRPLDADGLRRLVEAVSRTVIAHADELTDLKSQVEALNARVAAMESAPSVPTGYQLLAISKGEAAQVPGMLGSDRDRVVDNNATIISVMPTASRSTTAA